MSSYIDEDTCGLIYILGTIGWFSAIMQVIIYY